MDKKKYRKLDLARDIIATLIAICIIPVVAGIALENIILLLISGIILIICIIAYYKIRERILKMQLYFYQNYKYLGITEQYDVFEIEIKNQKIKIVCIKPFEAEIVETEISIKDAEKMFNLV